MNILELASRTPALGISAISTYQPPLAIPNQWYETRIPRKFVKHTGIESRFVSEENELSMARHAVDSLVERQGVRLQDCAGLVFVSPSYIPLTVARRLMSPQDADKEDLRAAAAQLCQDLAIAPDATVGLNGFCSGYGKAMSCVLTKLAPELQLTNRQFILVVTSSRISRITDFGCAQSGALFGDYATATLLSRTNSTAYPVHLELLDAAFEKKPANAAYFDFHRRQQVLAPAWDGKQMIVPERVVFSLNGMGIADTAPRAMAAAATEMAAAHGIAPDEFQHIIPHQAGAAIVRLTGMKLEEAGFTAAPVNGMTKHVGNISSGSVPFTLKRYWHQLSGNILCPMAAVGAPGKCEVSQSAILLRARQAKLAAAG